MLKGEGLVRRTDVVLIVLFNFVPRLPENLSLSLSLFFLAGSVFLCASSSATRRKRNTENRQFKTWEQRGTQLGK
jgi:hypothetical protein